ncbi:hypothetical protein VCHA47P369_30066 [Vibrio chagasii]|nr:hypothetical protein VCHA48P435_10462 [Vibrio chagasii]CAH7098946.1 hypothetical protein VCHA51O448_10518 [Vibrio chagasii]CAH7133288.1 hypothetical protein VCHA47P369_30066 [Vibrio chagasii]CAH7268446.1 hypothetical protein VCHA53O464_10528 [Vibrio chagasii]
MTRFFKMALSSIKPSKQQNFFQNKRVLITANGLLKLPVWGLKMAKLGCFKWLFLLVFNLMFSEDHNGSLSLISLGG